MPFKVASSVGAALMMTAMTFLALPQAAEGAHSQTGLCREINPEDALGDGFSRVAWVDESISPFSPIESGRHNNTQKGPGQSSESDENEAVLVPAGAGDILTAQMVDVNVTGDVNADPLIATQASLVQVTDVSILDGLVEANLLRSEAETFAKEKAAFTNSDGTTFGSVAVAGNRYTDIGPNTLIPLAPGTFGERSKVILFERVDDSRFPSTEKPFYAAELSVRMIHVIITDLQPQIVGDQRVEIIVAESYAFSQVPTPWCGPHQNVGASAYVGRFRDTPPPEGFADPGILVGWLELPPTGGQMNQSVQAPSVQEGDVNISMGHAETRVFGDVDIGEMSKSWSVSKIENMCIAPAGRDDCLVSAGMIRVESQSEAFSDRRASWGHMRMANLTVAGQDITKEVCPDLEEGDLCNPPKNYETKVVSGGTEYKVILNMRQRDPFSEGHTGYTVRGVWVEGPGLGLHIIGRAYSEAFYEPGA